MYSFSQLKKALSNPRIGVTEFNRLCHHGFGHRTADNVYNSEGIDVVEADWDNLIILDACRYDIFEELCTDLPGKLKKQQSKATATNQFLRQNFDGRTLHDTVYITANPQLYRLKNGILDAEPVEVTFHDCINVWKDNWDDEHRTVKPAVVTDTTLSNNDVYSDKRLIIHYMQPHAPYIGPTGVEDFPTDYLKFWASYKEGEFNVPLDKAKQAYRENLEIVLPHVRTLLQELRGKTVVTADHGELFGERISPIPIRQYGHPPYIYHPKLTTVPWLVTQNGERKQIIGEENQDKRKVTDVSDESVKNRLEDLGYV